MKTTLKYFLLENVNIPEYFYHGTSDINYDDIMKNGLKKPYLTDLYSKAEYYAEETIEDIGGDILILKVMIPNDKLLRVDFNELDEPVIVEEMEDENIPSKIRKAYSKYIKEHPESYDKNTKTININSNHYYISLDSVHSAQYDGIIKPEFIEII